MPSTASSSKRKARDVVEVVMPPRKRLRTATMTQETYWMEVLRLMEASESRAAESSRAAADREERLRAAITLVGTNVMQQNRILLRLEERMIAMERTEEMAKKTTGNEDGGRRDEAVDVPIFDATAEEGDDGEDEENGENKEEEVGEDAGKEVEK